MIDTILKAILPGVPAYLDLTATGALVNASLAAAALWYTWETAKQRRISERQLAQLLHQTRIQMAPIITFDLLTYSKEHVQKLAAEEDGDKTSQSTLSEIRAGDSEDAAYLCRINNISNRYGLKGAALYYDSEATKYLVSGPNRHIEVLRANCTEYIAIKCAPKNKKEAIEHFEALYPGHREFLKKHIVPRSRSFLMVFLCDMDKRLYCLYRYVASHSDMSSDEQIYRWRNLPNADYKYGMIEVDFDTKRQNA